MALKGPGIQPGAPFFLLERTPRSTYYDPYRDTRREQIILDNFERREGPLGVTTTQTGLTYGGGSGWISPVASRGFYIQESKVAGGLQGRARPLTTGNDNRSFYTAGVWPADQWAEIQLPNANIASSGNAGFGVIVRGTPLSNSALSTGFEVIIQHDLSFTHIQLLLNAAIIGTAKIRQTWTAGDFIGVEAQGQRYRIFRNRALVHEYYDATNTLTSGFPGILYSSTLGNPVKDIFSFAAGGFGSKTTTATIGVAQNDRRGPGIQPSARSMFQTSPRGITPPLDIGTPKEPLEWRSGPGIQPRKRLAFQTSPRSSDPDNQYSGFRRELTFDDEFRRGNGKLGAQDWKNFNGTPGTSLNIVAPGIVTPGQDQGASTDIVMVPALSTYPSDQWAEMKLLTSYGGGTLDRGPGLVLRANDTVNSYYGVTFRAGNSLMTFVLRSGGPIVESFAYRATFAVNDIVRFEAQGTTLRVLRNGVLVVQWSQLTNQLTDGRPGMVFLSPSSTSAAAPFFAAFAAGGFSPLGTTATVGFSERDRYGPGIQPMERFMFQASPRGITPPLDIGDPKDPLDWHAGPGIQPRARQMFQTTPRSTSPVATSVIVGRLFAFMGPGDAATSQAIFSTHVTMF
jgi:hypothetical protein